MLQNAPKHSAIFSTFIKRPFVIKIFVLSFLSGLFTQVLLYVLSNKKNESMIIQKVKESGYLLADIHILHVDIYAVTFTFLILLFHES